MALPQPITAHGEPVLGPPGPTTPAARAPRWVRARRVLRDAAGFFPLTWVGFAVLVVAALAGWYIGLGHLDMILLMVAFCALVALVVMLVLVIIGALVVRAAFTRPLGSTVNGLEAGAVSISGFAVRLPLWLPCLDVVWKWEDGEGTCPAETQLHHEGPVTYEVIIPRRRGIFSRIIRRIQVRDILGLCCITWRREEHIDLRVLPDRGRVEQLIPLMGFVSGDDISDPFGDPWGDRVDMRQYSPGDSPRMIMWKVFARSRKLMVRIPERAVAARPRGCAYLVADTSPRPTDEPGAGVARIVLERRLLGDGWSFAADGGGAPATTLDEALDALARSGTPNVPDTGFGDFIQKAQREGYGYCVLFVPPRPGRWLDPMLDAARRSSVRVHAFVGVDGLASDIERSQRGKGLVRKLVLYDDAPSGATLAETAEVVTKLSNAASQVCLVDRAEGQIFGNPLAVLAQAGGSKK